MRGTIARWIILVSIPLCAAISAPAAKPLSSVEEITARLQARSEGSETLRCRQSVGCTLAEGELAVFVDEEYTPNGFELDGFGLASPGCDLGPLKETGLLSTLNHPSSIGSAAERSAAMLDRSFYPGSLTGGVIRFFEPSTVPPTVPRVVELYAAERAGLAPVRTTTGGILLATGLGAGLSLDLGSKITLFGARKDNDDDWFFPAPESNPPAIFRTGARLSYRGHRVTAAVTAGAAFSDYLRPSAFATGSVGLSGDLPPGEGGRRPLWSARLDAGAVAPDYIGDDGRYTTRTLLLRPALSLHFPGLSLSGWYRCDLYPLPMLPAAYRRIVHAASVAGQVRFGPLIVGSVVRPKVDFAADGRTLYQVLCGPRARLAIGFLVLESELQLTRSNFDEPVVGARLAVSGQWERGTAGVDIDIAEGTGRLKASFAVVGKRWRLSASAALPEVLAVDSGALRIVRFGGPTSPFEQASCSVSIEFRGG